MHYYYYYYLLKAYSPVNCTRLLIVFIYLLEAYSPVNRTGSPQGFSLNQCLQKLKTIQNMHILQE